MNRMNLSNAFSKAVVVTSLIVSSTCAQNSLPTTGYVGIGTPAPIDELEIRDAYRKTPRISIVSSSKYVGDAPLIQTKRTCEGKATTNGMLLARYTTWGMSASNYENTTSNIDFIQDGNANVNVPVRLEFNLNSGDGLQNRMTILSNGSVGIGTKTPEQKLDIRGATTIQNNPNVPTDDIAIKRPGVLSSSNVRFVFSERETNDKLWIYGFDGVTYKNFVEFNYPKNNVSFLSGNVGIGCAGLPDAKLTVAGKIVAKEVQVSIDNTKFPDYVFKPNYKLMSVRNVETYIKQNGHLPEIPSANEAVKNGVNVGEMQAKLLQKVEELTLYVIEINKDNQELRKELAILNNH